MATAQEIADKWNELDAKIQAGELENMSQEQLDQVDAALDQLEIAVREKDV